MNVVGWEVDVEKYDVLLHLISHSMWTDRPRSLLALLPQARNYLFHFSAQKNLQAILYLMGTQFFKVSFEKWNQGSQFLNSSQFVFVPLFPFLHQHRHLHLHCGRTGIARGESGFNGKARFDDRGSHKQDDIRLNEESKEQRRPTSPREAKSHQV